MQMFNVRVYGILIHNNSVLVSDEMIKGNYFTKFPGGGLEFGEGTRDCLEREFKEETGLNIEVREHLYTTDYYQPSAFHPDHQILSVYYYVTANGIESLRTVSEKNAFSAEQIASGEDCEVFRWISLNDLKKDDVSLPIDQIVVGILKG